MNSQILDIETARQQGHEIIGVNEETEQLLLTGELINPKYKEYLILTNSKQINEQIERCESRPVAENKRIWLSILRNLNQYTPDELNRHYELCDRAWKNWCDDAVLWYCYNAVVFNKGIPAVRYTDNLKKFPIH